MLLHIPQDGGKDMSRAESIGMLITQHPASASESVFGELASDLILPQPPQDGGMDTGRDQGMGMVCTQHAQHAGEGVLDELVG
jgi:hypothetical protein